MSSIDRVRYYDGEFLRAFDFGDEQTYHMEMRRRLNRYLHLYGIVQGLQLQDDPQAGVHQVSILPGMAIDAFGREIYLFAPYTFGDADITANRISTAGPYDVWLRYNKTASTPPSAGYAQCNQTNQYTRWLESYSVVLLPSPSSPFTPPAFTDDDTDNPSQDQVGVLLGTISVDPSSVLLQFSTPVFHHRHFLGIIAQRIHTPIPYDATPFNFPLKQSAHNPPVSLDIEPNVFARQNLILGPDFDLQTTLQTKVPAVHTPGSAKIAGDLFVQGSVYSSIPDSKTNIPQWLGLSDYVNQLVQQSMPDLLSNTSANQTVPIIPNKGNYVSGSTPVSVTSTKISNISSFVAFAFITDFQFDTQTNINTLGPLQVQLSIDSVSPHAPSGATCTIDVNWTAGPATGLGGFSAVNNFTIRGVFICFPS